MRLLYFTLEGFDTPNPNNHLAETMIEYFLMHDVKVDLIQSKRALKNDAVPKSLNFFSNLKVYSIHRTVIKKNNFIKRYIEEATFVFKSIKTWIYNKDKYDVLYVQSNATIVWTIILFKLLIRKPIVYAIYDVFPGQSYSLGIVKFKFLYKTFELLQKIAYCYSSKIIVLSEDMKNSLIKLNVSEEKIEIVYPWYDDKKFIPLSINENFMYEKLKLRKNAFYLQYAGSLGQNFDEDFIFQLSKKLKVEDSNIIILLIGDGVKEEKIKKYIIEHDLSNIEVRDRQDLKNINYVYNACDLGVIPLMSDVIKYGFPSKACQLMACGKPIITYTEISAYSNFINSGFGFAGHNNIEEFVEKIITFKNDKSAYNICAVNCINYSKQNYTAEINCNKILKILEGVYNV